MAGLLAASYLAVAVAALGDYGPTWDTSVFEFPYGRTLIDYLRSVLPGDPPVESAPRAPHPYLPAVQGAWFHAYPVGSMLSELGCRLLWTWLGVLDAIAAHHVVVPVSTALLLVAMIWFLGRRAGLAAGVGAALLLVLSPRYFAHSCNNLKDAPEAALYGFAVLAGARALHRGGRAAWALAGCAVGLALAQKANALFVPMQLAAYFALAKLLTWRAAGRAPRWSWRGLGYATASFVVTYLAVSPAFWNDTFQGLATHFSYIFSVGTVAELASQLEPRPLAAWDGTAHAAWTTPLPVLGLALVGLVTPRAPATARLLLALWVVVPVGRTALPGMRNFDGVRHFLEFYPPLCMLAGLGLATIAGWLRGRRRSLALLWLAALLPGGIATWRTHPHGICYFNACVGGLGGAQQRGIPEATDYWGSAYWQGAAWLTRQASAEANVLVPVAPHIVRCLQPVRLRPDLRLVRGGEQDTRHALYVMYITRKNWYTRYVRDLEQTNKPVHEIRVQGGTILRIHRFDNGGDADVQWAAWDRDRAALAARGRMLKPVENDPARLAQVASIMVRAADLGPGTAARRLRALLPEAAPADLAEVLWLYGAEGG
ncbi:MAG: glycosyltransferase family 39 protein [Planctomycetota bacterium]